MKLLLGFLLMAAHPYWSQLAAKAGLIQ